MLALGVTIARAQRPEKRDCNALSDRERKKVLCAAPPLSCGLADPTVRLVSRGNFWAFPFRFWKDFDRKGAATMDDLKITPETEVSASGLACVLGITGRNIRQLVEDGQLEKTDGRFLLCDSVQRYVAFKSRKEKDDEEQRLDKARRTAEVTLRASKAQIVKMEADELRGKMHRSEDVAAMTEDLIYTMRGSLMALPGRLAVDVAAAASPAEAAEIIRKEVYAIMRELANYEYDPEKYEERVRERRNWEAGGGDVDDE